MRKDFDNRQSLSYLPIAVTFFLFSHLTRDLKLENTLINAHGHVRVGDLGLATLSNVEKQHDICGTCYYMAPEVSQRELFAFLNIPRLSVNVSRISKKDLYITPHEQLIVLRRVLVETKLLSEFFSHKQPHIVIIISTMVNI